MGRIDIPYCFCDGLLQRLVHAGVLDVISKFGEVRGQVCRWCISPIHTKCEQRKKELVDILPRLCAACGYQCPVQLLESVDEALHRGIGFFEQADEFIDGGALMDRDWETQGEWVSSLLAQDTTNKFVVLVDIRVVGHVDRCPSIGAAGRNSGK